MDRMRARCCATLALTLALAVGVACASGTAPVAPLSGKSEKREGPALVPPVRIGAVEFSVVHWGLERGLAQNGGYIAARDAASGRELWILKVYDVRYDPARERDVQDTFIVEMKPDASGRALTILDELDREYLVDPGARTVRIVRGGR